MRTFPCVGFTNDYLIDRRMQREVNMSGLHGLNDQDRCMQEGMSRNSGPLAGIPGRGGPLDHDGASPDTGIRSRHREPVGIQERGFGMAARSPSVPLDVVSEVNDVPH